MESIFDYSVLLWDDDPLHASLIKMVLHAAGLQLIKAATIKEAIQTSTLKA
jgi:hypothetical protein